MTKDRIEECFGKIQESIQTMNHNSTTTAQAMNRIADAIDKIQDGIASGFTATSVEHKGMTEKLDKELKPLIGILKWAIIALIVVIAGVVGVNLKIPFIS